MHGLKGNYYFIGLRLCKHLDREYRPSAAVFVTDVPGIYDKSPNEVGAKLLRYIIVKPDGSVSLPD